MIISVVDAGQFLGFRRDRHARIDRLIRRIRRDETAMPVRLEQNGGNLDQPVHGRIQTGRLDIERDKAIFQVGIVRQPGDRLAVVDQIAFHAVDDLDVFAFLLRAPAGLRGIRKSLDHAVVGDGDGRVAEGSRQADQSPASQTASLVLILVWRAARSA